MIGLNKASDLPLLYCACMLCDTADPHLNENAATLPGASVGCPARVRNVTLAAMPAPTDVCAATDIVYIVYGTNVVTLKESAVVVPSAADDISGLKSMSVYPVMIPLGTAGGCQLTTICSGGEEE